jgi:mRNA-decapping enzyme subunit 2
MVAPFLPPLKKWINLQKKRDAARLLQAGSLPEELEYVPSDTPNLETHVLSEPPAGAADELKRLLSVNVVAANSDQTAGNDGNQANALLAMLRGNSSLAPPVEAPLPPRTPLDQVFTTPPEPGTPHHQHPQPSPAVRQQAPPAFPFSSPAQQVNHQHTNSLHPPGFFGQDAQRTQQRLVPQMSHMSQQSAHESRHIYPTGSHPSMQQQLFPGGHPAQISHGPIAPSASQLPAPRLNNHAMNLLNAFKAPAYAREASPVNHHVMPHANMNYPQSQHQVPTGEPPQGRRRSAHQNSLLDLFKSPEAQKAAPVAQTPPDNVPTPRNNQPIVPVTSSTAGIPINQKGVNTAMMTRTLPRHKSATGGDMFPAKHAVQKAQAAQNRSTSEASSMGTRRGPVSILPRPGSSTTTMTTTREPDGAPSPHKPRRGHKSESPSNFTILQRPSPRADRNGSPGIAEGKKMLAQKQQAQRHDVSRRAQEAPKQFQPQILQRPRADKAATSPSLEQQLHNDGDARNTLLALFAKQKPGMGNIEARSASAMSGGSGAPLAADSSIFRSRLASASSVVSNGGDNDGLRSPATPVEAKGFLLDYLNGVVKNEKNKGGVRRGPG